MTARSGALGIVLVVSLPLIAGCSPGPSEGRPAAACSVPPEIQIPADIPADFPWVQDVTVTQAELTKKFVSITGFGRRSVEELFELMHDELKQKDFDIINTDFEGFEAELFFAKGNSLAGIASMREGPCDGYVKMNVVYDPLETEEGRAAVRKTRRLSGEGPDS